MTRCAHGSPPKASGMVPAATWQPACRAREGLASRKGPAHKNRRETNGKTALPCGNASEKGHGMMTIGTEATVLELWAVERTAVIFMPAERGLRFAAAIGFDAELGTCDELHRFNRATDAWNLADPSICETLSEPVSRSTLRCVFAQVGFDATDPELREFERNAVRTFAGAGDADGLMPACKWAYEHGFAEREPA